MVVRMVSGVSGHSEEAHGLGLGEKHHGEASVVNLLTSFTQIVVLTHSALEAATHERGSAAAITDDAVMGAIHRVDATSATRSRTTSRATAMDRSSSATSAATTTQTESATGGTMSTWSCSTSVRSKAVH